MGSLEPSPKEQLMSCLNFVSKVSFPTMIAFASLAITAAARAEKGGRVLVDPRGDEHAVERPVEQAGTGNDRRTDVRDP